MLGVWLRRRLREYSNRLLLESIQEAPTRTLLGIDVVDWERDDEKAHDAVFDVISEALLVIDRCYPTGLSSLGSLDRILVSRLPNRTGEYWAQVGAAVVNRDAVLSSDGWWVSALTIIHEATHARLGRLGIGYDAGCRDRIEGICTRREIALARRMDGGADWVRWLAERTHVSAPTDLELADLRAEKYLALMASSGVPQVILGVLRRYHQLRRNGWRRSSRDVPPRDG